jgi:L-amino acid N-acyltransferase YncA
MKAERVNNTVILRAFMVQQIEVMVTIRPVTIDNASEILDIYKPYILNSAISFEAEVPSLTDMQARIEKCVIRYPWLVCYIENKLAGYAYASIHRERAAYQWTCESSIYMHDNFKGKGIAREIYLLLISILKMQGIRNVYAGITLPNEPSVLLHEKCGFEQFATYDHIGYKLGRWEKVGWWRLLINDLNEEPSPPIYFSQLNRQSILKLMEAASLRIQSKLISHTGWQE